MNNNNNIPNFEQFLRESVDDFRMMPARKIWYGIYNQMHPSKKWPSLAVSLLILIAILFVGISNNNKINSGTAKNNTPYTSSNTHKQQVVYASNNISTKTANENAISNATFLNANDIVPTNTSTKIYDAQVNFKNKTEKNITLLKENNLLNKTTNNNSILTSAENTKAENKDIGGGAFNEKIIINNIEDASNNVTTYRNNKVNIENIAAQNITKTTFKNEQNFSKNNLSTSIEKETIEKTKITLTEETSIKTNVENSVIIEKNKAEKDSYVTKNKTTINKLKEKGSLQYYVTPSIGYRKIGTNRPNNMVNQQAITTEMLKDIAALNLEFGTALHYNVRKNINAKVGIQVNYTNYVSKVVDLGHTLQTSVATNSFNTARNASVSSYLTEEGKDRLNKTTWQIAVPIGADIMLAGNEKIKWYVGSTLQPTYILGGSAMVLSYDMKNYISEKSLLRKFNVNAAVETYLSLKTAKGISLTVGPQFRYQLFSTYKNTYNYSEKLYNLGVKVGVSTSF
jgi:hypothetical protein